MSSPVFQKFQRIALFGSADISENNSLYQEAFLVAQALGKLGVTIVNGGGPGVMKAATDGATAAGAKSFTVSFAPTDAPFFEGKERTNIASQDLEVDNYFDRLRLLIENADAFIVFRGGTGTLSEWTTVWLLAHIYFGHHKPFLLYGEFWHEVLDVMKKHFFLGEAEFHTFRVVTDLEEVVPALVELEAERQT